MITFTSNFDPYPYPNRYQTQPNPHLHYTYIHYTRIESIRDYITDIEQVCTFQDFFQIFFYCKFECGQGLENTQSKRHSLIHLRKLKIADSSIVSMTAILEGNWHLPCGGTIEGLYLSVLDFEDRTLKTIKFCVWWYG